MKAKFFGRILPIFLLVALLASFALPFSAANEGESPIVSHGLLVLSAKTDVSLSSMAGNDIVFSADLLARGLNLANVRYITVQSVPSITFGELMLGSSKVVAGQVITAEQMPNLVFSPAVEHACCASFTFTANELNVPVICNLYVLDEINYTPTVSVASSLSLTLNTYKGRSAYGILSAYDPDGDDLCYEIVSYPQNGSVLMLDAEQGTYVYTPNAKHVGSDSFSYVARDPYGNYSAMATVTLSVSLCGTDVTYADMENSRAYNSALELTEEGIMSGVQVGDRYYFYPENYVTREEFLVMAMHAIGITEVPECKATAFADDADIEEGMKGYVAMAHTLGYIQGSAENGSLYFRPDQTLTRAEAAVILERMLGLGDAKYVPTFADHQMIPVWAADAIFALHEAGIMIPTDNYIAPTETLNRAETAMILSAILHYDP